MIVRLPKTITLLARITLRKVMKILVNSKLRNMKKAFLVFILAVIWVSLYAQDTKSIKKLLDKGDIQGAKAQVDAFVSANPASAEGQYLKAKIYESVAQKDQFPPTAPDAPYIAFDAFKKAMENLNADKGFKLQSLTDKTFNDPIFNLYSDYTKRGSSYYGAATKSNSPADYQKAMNDFISAYSVRDYLRSSQIATVSDVDTTLALFIGQAAMNAERKDVAEKYFKILADAGIAGTKASSEGFQLPYEWLAEHYRDAKDETNMLKYIEKGEKLFPNDLFLTQLTLDYYRKNKNYTSLFKKYQELISKNPDSTNFHINYASEAFNYLFADEKAIIPNKDQILDIVSNELTGVLAKNPDNIRANQLLAQYYYNVGSDERKRVSSVKGTAPADVKKRTEMISKSKEYLNKSLPYLNRAIADLERTNRKADKSTYKSLVDLTAQVYSQLQQADKAKLYEQKYDSADKTFVN
jgi:hypothetical protein